MGGYQVDRQPQILQITSSRKKTSAYKTLSILKLVERVAVHQDKKAFACLFDTFAPRVKSFMLQKNSSIEQAEALVQETMIEVWRNAKNYSASQASVAAWIFTIARNIRLESQRVSCARVSLDLVACEAQLENTSTKNSLARFQYDKRLNQAIAVLPEEQRKLLFLNFTQDMTYGEMAKREQIPLGVIKAQLRLAFRNLCKFL
jgi:RNA polymerase sigma-70 factor, ECF subfamily